jgi:nucleoside-diphosphate kinase
MQHTFSMIKPDATKRKLGEIINQIFVDNKLEIVQSQKIKLSDKIAREFYAEHKERSFFNEMISEITSGEVIIQILKGTNAIQRNREIMGETDPKNAAPGTIRAKYGISIGENSIHGSDSEISAKREINLMFPSFDNKSS